MTKPTDTYAWATTPGATEEPPADAKASGFIYGQRPPPRWHNWLWNGAYRWFEYLKNLHGEPEFLSKGYPWTGKHSFAQAVQGDLKITGEVLYDEAKVRHMMLPLTGFQPQTSTLGEPFASAWYLDDLPLGPTYWGTERNYDALIGHFRLPSGVAPAYLTTWVILATGADFQLKAERLRFTTQGTPSRLPVVDELTSPLVTPGPWDATITIPLDQSKTFNADTDMLRVRLEKGGSASTHCSVYWVELLFTEVGPHY